MSFTVTLEPEPSLVIQIDEPPDSELVARTVTLTVPQEPKIVVANIHEVGIFGGDSHYLHSQDIPAFEWIITHNLGKFPAVQVLDTAQNHIHSKIIHDSNMVCRAIHGAMFSGKASCN